MCKGVILIFFFLGGVWFRVVLNVDVLKREFTGFGGPLFL